VASMYDVGNCSPDAVLVIESHPEVMLTVPRAELHGEHKLIPILQATQ